MSGVNTAGTKGVPRAAREAQLLDIAAEDIGRLGYAGLSVGEVAAGAGVCHLPRGWDHRLVTNYGPPVWLIGDDRRSSGWCQLRAFDGVGRTGPR